MPTVSQTASLLALFLCVATCLSPSLGRTAVVPQTSVQEDGMETLRLSGLREPVEILTDRWGIAHIYFLISLRNRLIVATQWLWSYVSFERGARLTALRRVERRDQHTEAAWRPLTLTSIE